MAKTMLMGDVMTPCPHKVEAGTSLNDALQVMTLRGVRHLPVVEEGSLVGILSEREVKLMSAMTDDIRRSVRAGDISMKEPFVVSTGDLLADVAQEMADNKSDCALVVDEDNNFVGIFTSTDACRVIHLVLSEQELQGDAD